MKETNQKSIKAPSWHFLFALSLGLILLSGFNPCKSQNLQFSQVLYIASGTVPAGKVWKLERVFCTGVETLMLINGESVGPLTRSWVPSGGNASVSVAFPHAPWFPATTTLGGSGILRFSIIEFTVVP